MLEKYKRHVDEVVAEYEDGAPMQQKWMKIQTNVNKVIYFLNRNKIHLDALDDALVNSADFLNIHARFLRCFFELGCYYRRWAGPQRILPIGHDRSQNPKGVLRIVEVHKTPSPKLDGKFVTPSVSGARLLSADPSGRHMAADTVEPLRGDSQTWRPRWHKSFRPLTPCPGISGFSLRKRLGPWHSVLRPGRSVLVDQPGAKLLIQSSLPDARSLRLVLRGSGGDRQHPRGFHATRSTQGNGQYCVQLAAIQILRTVLTLLPYAYLRTPQWAMTGAPFHNTHT